MLKFLSTVRRILLAGTISLILIFVFSLLRVSVPTINAPVAFSTAYTSFAFVSPVLGLIFWLISTIYIRKKGQSSAYQQTQPFFSTMIKMLISDITSPFRLIGEQFASKKKLTEYYSQMVDVEIAKMLAAGSKALNREKLLRTIIRFIIYIAGIIESVHHFSSFKFPFI